MFTKGAIEDILFERLYGKQSISQPKIAENAASDKKVFISDWQLRRLYVKGSRIVKVPSNAILSPLSIDWLDYEGIKVIRE